MALLTWLGASYWLQEHGPLSWPQLVISAIIVLAFLIGCFLLQWLQNRPDKLPSVSTAAPSQVIVNDFELGKLFETAKNLADGWWRYVAVFLILLTITATGWLLVRSQATVPIGLLQDQARQLQEKDKLLQECLRRPCNASVPGGETVVNLPPKIEDALLLLLKRLPDHDGGPGWGAFWIIIIALIVVGFVAWKHAEAIPISAAVALSKWLIDHADRFPKTGNYTFLLLIVVFTAIAASLSLPFFKAAIRWSTGEVEKAALPNIDRDVLKDLLSINFSLAVLVWSIVIVVLMGHCSDCPASVSTSPPPPPTKTEYRYEWLPPERPFVRGSHELTDPSRSTTIVKDAVAKGGKAGDILLLFGSADCLRFRPGSLQVGGSNQILAKQRAEELARTLLPYTAGIEVNTINDDAQADKNGPLQHTACKESPDLRAVYPLLIRKVTVP